MYIFCTKSVISTVPTSFFNKRITASNRGNLHRRSTTVYSKYNNNKLYPSLGLETVINATFTWTRQRLWGRGKIAVGSVR